jgi:hypothetical protein
MLQPYVSCVLDVCCICFDLDVVKIDMVLHMLQWLYTYVANICFKCFKLYVASVFIWMLHMLHWLYMYVASVCFKCFSYFQTYNASVLSGCCICCSPIHVLQTYVVMFHMFWTYVAANVLCCKCFMSKRRRRWSPQAQRACGKRSRRGARCGSRHEAWGEAKHEPAYIKTPWGYHYYYYWKQVGSNHGSPYGH